MIRILALAAVATAVPVPTTKYVVKLRNGVEMPMMAAGTWQYPGKTMVDHDRTLFHCHGRLHSTGHPFREHGKALMKLFPALNLDLLASEPQPRYNSSEAYSSITSALKAGFSVVDTALDYHNQDLVL